MGFCYSAIDNKKTHLSTPVLVMDKTLLLLYPIVLLIGRFDPYHAGKIQRSFIEVNNQLVRSRAVKVEKAELFIAPAALPSK